MSHLSARMQLAMLNRKKSRNPLEKGFTLVELMVVIAIVGILSAIAIPSFFSQAGKAKITEAETLASAYIKEYSAEELIDAAAAAAAETACVPTTGDWSFACDETTVTVSPTASNTSWTAGTLVVTLNATSNEIEKTDTLS